MRIGITALIAALILTVNVGAAVTKATPKATAAPAKAAEAKVLTLPEKVTISAASKKQPPVTFPHAAHATKLVAKCETCHHTQKGLSRENLSDVKKCSSCHLDAKGKVPSMREMSLQKNPFHALCITCHKAQKKGPVTCTACHAKK